MYPTATAPLVLNERLPDPAVKILDKSFEKKWAGDLTAVYLAGAYELLKKHGDAERLIKGYKLGVHDPHGWNDFHSALGADSQRVLRLRFHKNRTSSRVAKTVTHKTLEVNS